MLKPNLCRLAAGLCLLSSLLVHGRPSCADDPPAVAPSPNQNMVTEFKGTLKGFQQGVLIVEREDGTEIMVQPPEDRSAFQFIATAKPAFLQRGMMVRFNGTFNQAGVPMAPVPRLEIFQPITGKVPNHSREKFLPGVHADRKDRGKPPQPTANYTVVGQLMGWDASGGFMVQAGQRAVRAQLTQTPTLEIRFNNLNLAQEGDPVTVAGFYQPPDETKVRGDRVTITTDRVFGEPVEPTKRNSRRRRRGEEAKDADSPAQEAGKADAPEQAAGENKGDVKSDEPAGDVAQER